MPAAAAAAVANDPTVVFAMSRHANEEERAARIYEQAALWCDFRMWPGSAAFFRGEASDELEHARRWRGYAIDRGTLPVLEQQASPLPDVNDWKDPTKLIMPFTAALALERMILDQINELSAAAAAAGDYEAVQWMAEFLDVGRKSIRDLEEKQAWLARAGADWCALQAFDRSLQSAG